MLTIKPYTPSDYPSYYSVAHQLFEETYSSLLSPQQIAYMMPMMYGKEAVERAVTKGDSLFMAYYNNQLCGYLHLEKVSSNKVILQKIYLHSSLQGKGIGRQLLTYVFEYTRQQLNNQATIELYVNRENPAVNFYQHIGFKIVGSRDYDIGGGYYMNDYIMHYQC